MELSENYILNAIFTYAGNPTLNRYDGTYNCGCPICHEGKSWGKKKRLFYYPQTKSFYCFNCSQSWSAKQWIHKLTGLSYSEMLSEDAEETFSKDVSLIKPEFTKKQILLPSLPHDSVNITEETQKKYYQNNFWVNKAWEYIKIRRLDTAINSCKTFYMSFTDRIHKNRLIIPFRDLKGNIIYYQSRALDDDSMRYIGKYGDKSIFGIDRIDPDFDYIFLFEGPIDSMFVRNGIGLTGLRLTENQKKQLNDFPLHQKIWILDNISVVKDDETKEKTLELLNSGEKVYRWHNQYKDFNDWAVNEKLDSIDYKEILSNLY